MHRRTPYQAHQPALRLLHLVVAMRRQSARVAQKQQTLEASLELRKGCHRPRAGESSSKQVRIWATRLRLRSNKAPSDFLCRCHRTAEFCQENDITSKRAQVNKRIVHRGTCTNVFSTAKHRSRQRCPPRLCVRFEETKHKFTSRFRPTCFRFRRSPSAAGGH